MGDTLFSMREVSFLRQRSESWKRAEALVEKARTANPDDLAGHFVELTDDLSYARTFYPDGRTTAYLNELTARFFGLIYKNRREEAGRIRRFFARDVPLAVRRAHRHLLAATVVFLVAAAIGVLSGRNDPTFARLILSDYYVDMTEANIAKNDPMAVYKEMSPVVMYFQIAFNNFRVGVISVALGVFTAIGAGYILFNNGVMVGVFQDFFAQRGLGLESALVIWIHGALEIPSIVVCGGAGLLLGSAWLFPGSYPRGEAFQRGAKDALRIFLGTAPVILFAALLESFVTRYTGMPVWLSLAIILGSLGFIVWYYVLYPIRVTRHARPTPA